MAHTFIDRQLADFNRRSNELADELDQTFEHQRAIIEEMKRIQDAINALKGRN